MGTLVLEFIGATIAACLLATRLRSVRSWLPGVVQFFSGLLIPPLITWLAFEYDAPIEGNHNSAALLLVAWFGCIIVGMLFSKGFDR